MYPSYTFIYHSIPSYDGICEYMSGYQGVRIPDVHLQYRDITISKVRASISKVGKVH